MKFFFNDLSLAGQYSDIGSFCRELDELLRARERSSWLRTRLFCSTTLGDRPATATHTFREAVQSSGNRDLLRRVLGWIGKSGPFWEEDRTQVADDLFYFDKIDVTDQGLGEAARRRLVASEDASFSLAGSPHHCDADALVVQQGLLGEPLGQISIPNYPGIARCLDAEASLLPPVQSWAEMLERVKIQFDSIILAPDIGNVLKPHPFSGHVSERVIELIGVLHRFVQSRDPRGDFTSLSHEILANFFSGDRARFSDESRTNKNKFRAELTFSDPEDSRLKLFCPFHGKINTPPYRIHFAWPLESSQRKVKVVYIGPKITR